MSKNRLSPRISTSEIDISGSERPKNHQDMRSNLQRFKKLKIIEIDLRSSENGGPERYRSQGGSPYESGGFRTIELQMATHVQ